MEGIYFQRKYNFGKTKKVCHNGSENFAQYIIKFRIYKVKIKYFISIPNIGKVGILIFMKL